MLWRFDHFHPLAAGGSDEVENLVHACTACNRFKGDYAPAPDAPDALRLLRPQRDDMSAHITETTQGRLLGLTPRGWFHIQRLHLNRAQLIDMRHSYGVMQTQKDELLRAREAEARLRQENSALQRELARLWAVMIDLLRRGERRADPRLDALAVGADVIERAARSPQGHRHLTDPLVCFLQVEFVLERTVLAA